MVTNPGRQWRVGRWIVEASGGQLHVQLSDSPERQMILTDAAVAGLNLPGVSTVADMVRHIESLEAPVATPRHQLHGSELHWVDAGGGTMPSTRRATR